MTGQGFHTPDEIALRYFELCDSRYSLSAQDLRAIRGVVCALCKGGPSTLIFRGRRVPGRWYYEQVCATCYRPWRQDDSGEFDVLKTKEKRSRNAGGGGGSEDRLIRDLDELSALASIMQARPRSWSLERWNFALRAWKVYLHPLIGSYRAAADYGLKCDPGGSRFWTELAVKRWVRRARLVVDTRSRRIRAIHYTAPLRRLQAPRGAA